MEIPIAVKLTKPMLLRFNAILLIVGVSAGVSVIFCTYLGHHYFFDKFFYRKSPAYGYQSATEWDILTSDTTEIMNRTKDIRSLVAMAKNQNHKVLGSRD